MLAYVLMEFSQMGRVDGYNPQNNRKDIAFSWTDVYEKEPTSSVASGSGSLSLVFFVCPFFCVFQILG